MSSSVPCENHIDPENSKIDTSAIPGGLRTPVTTRSDIYSTSKVTCIRNEVDLDECRTPLAVSQNSFLSHSQEVIPIARFHEQLQQLSMCLGKEQTLTILSPSKELTDTNSNSDLLGSLESSPGSGRPTSFDNVSLSDMCNLPSRQEIFHSIYERMSDYLKEEIQRRTNISLIAAKTPGKLDLCYKSFCPPIKRFDRRLRLSGDSSQEPVASKRISISL